MKFALILLIISSNPCKSMPTQEIQAVEGAIQERTIQMLRDISSHFKMMGMIDNQQGSQPQHQPGQSDPSQHPQPQAQHVSPKSKLEQMLEQKIPPQVIVAQLEQDARAQQLGPQIGNLPQNGRQIGNLPQNGQRIGNLPQNGQQVDNLPQNRPKLNLEQMIEQGLSPEVIVSTLARDEQSRQNHPTNPQQGQKSTLEQMMEKNLPAEVIVAELAREQEANMEQQLNKGQQGQGQRPMIPQENLRPVPYKSPVQIKRFQQRPRQQQLQQQQFPQQQPQQQQQFPQQQPQEQQFPQRQPQQQQFPQQQPQQQQFLQQQRQQPQQFSQQQLKQPQQFPQQQLEQPQQFPQQQLEQPQQFQQQLPPQESNPITQIQQHISNLIPNPQLNPIHHTQLQNIQAHLAELLLHPQGSDQSRLQELLEQLPQIVLQLGEIVKEEIGQQAQSRGRVEETNSGLRQVEPKMTQSELLQSIHDQLSKLFQHNLPGQGSAN